MINLKELLHSITTEKKNGLIDIDSWRWPDVDHLVNMGFEFGDDYHLNTSLEPKMTVYKKKDLDETGGETCECFYIEEKDRETKRFKNFSDVIDYFDTYVQPDLDKNK